MATDFTGYIGIWEFDDWELERFTIKTPPDTGHIFVDAATNVAAKANVESQGLRIDTSDIGAIPAYTRKFYFAHTYRSGSSTQSIANFLTTRNVLVGDDEVEWAIMSVSNPGGANEHFEVETVRRPQGS